MADKGQKKWRKHTEPQQRERENKMFKQVEDKVALCCGLHGKSSYSHSLMQH